jgi:hypothetical protein
MTRRHSVVIDARHANVYLTPDRPERCLIAPADRIGGRFGARHVVGPAGAPALS